MWQARKENNCVYKRLRDASIATGGDAERSYVEVRSRGRFAVQPSQARPPGAAESDARQQRGVDEEDACAANHKAQDGLFKLWKEVVLLRDTHDGSALFVCFGGLFRSSKYCCTCLFAFKLPLPLRFYSVSYFRFKTV